jgi:DNA-binding transcriptional ArsR family regulator
MSVESEESWDAIFAALAVSNRRSILDYLLSRGKATPEGLSRYLLRGGEEPTETELTSVQIQLRHVVIPVLEEAKLLKWDSEQEHVAPTSLAARLPSDIVAPSLSLVRTDNDEAEALE